MGNLEPVNFDNFFEKIFQANSSETLMLLGLSMVIWIVGGNLLIHSHRRRIGKSEWSFLNPFRHFNRFEWMVFFALGVSAFTLGVLALNV